MKLTELKNMEENALLELAKNGDSLAIDLFLTNTKILLRQNPEPTSL